MASELPSKKQRALLEFIDAFIRKHGYAPSYREVMRGLEYKSVSTVAKHIDGLIVRGWLVKRGNTARSVEVWSGQGTDGKSPVPSLPRLAVSDEQGREWLITRIEERRKTAGPEPETAAAIRVTLAYLGLDDEAQAD